MTPEPENSRYSPQITSKFHPPCTHHTPSTDCNQRTCPCLQSCPTPTTPQNSTSNRIPHQQTHARECHCHAEPRAHGAHVRRQSIDDRPRQGHERTREETVEGAEEKEAGRVAYCNPAEGQKRCNDREGDVNVQGSNHVS